MKKSLLLSILTLLLTLPATAFAATERVDVGQLRYTVDTDANTAEVNGPISSNEKIHNLVIPDFIDYNGSQIPVTSIRNQAFWGCRGFTGTLIIGNSVTTIGDDAFQGCSGFTGSLTIGDSVTTIGGRAFQDCSGFTGSLTIGDSVTTIEDHAFYRCSGFTGSLTIGDSVTTIGIFAFYECSGFTGSLTIGDSVTTIGNHAFNGCSGFTGSLTIGNSVTSIGNYAFVSCSGFTGSLTIGDSVTSIGNSAFNGCRNISSLDIKSTDLKINYYAFFGMDALQSITCYATTPPKCIYSGGFNNIFSRYTPQLYVPQQAIEKYKTATEWKKFSNIKPISDPATSITLNKSELNLTVGDSETLIASLLPENATETVTWSSADEAVATVDVDGLVKAVSVGTTTITATTVDGLTAECSVTVTEDSGVSGIYDNDLRVSVRGSIITVSGAADKAVSIMAADGKPVFTAQGDCQANVVPGFYLVVVGDNVTKVVAKY